MFGDACRMKKPHVQLARREQAFYSIFFRVWCLPVRLHNYAHKPSSAAIMISSGAALLMHSWMQRMSAFYA